MRLTIAGLDRQTGTAVDSAAIASAPRKTNEMRQRIAVLEL